MVYNDEMDYISYSQYNTYTKCPRSWYLGKIAQGEEKQTWYLPIGSAVHDLIELHLQGDPLLPSTMEDVFYHYIRKQMEIEPDLSKWMAGGPEAAPIKEERALQKVTECFEKAVQELEAIEVWEVEADISWSLPGLDVPVKAFTDIIGEHNKKGPVILDWKTGSTKPGNFQLETYAALLKSNASHPYSLEDFKGRYVMLAPGAPNTRYIDLSDISPAEVGAKYQAVYDRMQGKHYEAKAGFNCRFCFQAENCLVNKGMTPRSLYYDKSEEDGYPF